MASGEFRDRDESSPSNRLDDELSDAITNCDVERLERVGVEQHHRNFATVSGIDRAGRIDEADAMFRGEAGAVLRR
jgi:hypothetical protein